MKRFLSARPKKATPLLAAVILFVVPLSANCSSVTDASAKGSNDKVSNEGTPSSTAAANKNRESAEGSKDKGTSANSNVKAVSDTPPTAASTPPAANPSSPPPAPRIPNPAP